MPYVGKNSQRLSLERKLEYLDLACWDAAKKFKDPTKTRSAETLKAGEIVAFNSCHVLKAPPPSGVLRRTLFFGAETKDTQVSQGVIFANTYKEKI